MSVITEVKDLVEVHRYTRGLIGPSTEPDQVVRPGGRVRTVSPPGCWGPMITPHFVGGHEVSWPVGVEGAKVGDAIAITIERVRIRSLATSSGTMITKEAAFGSDPFVDRKCPGCGTAWPETRVEGTGEGAIRCVTCGEECSPFGFEEGYTIVFDDDRVVGV
ncbi:MAG: acetamidase/formamidase family protein, partial [Solirubrobacterales bacterium]|nr:acetamidase/formamidase family protein [Solirubrobacterales bacterium]